MRVQRTPEERFWAKVEKNGPLPPLHPELGPCWLWSNGRALAMGYGSLSVDGVQVMAHRFAYELMVGPIPAGLELDHLCCVGTCVRPTHLEPVTHQENIRRSWAPPARATRSGFRGITLPAT